MLLLDLVEHDLDSLLVCRDIDVDSEPALVHTRLLHAARLVGIRNAGEGLRQRILTAKFAKHSLNKLLGDALVLLLECHPHSSRYHDVGCGVRLRNWLKDMVWSAFAYDHFNALLDDTSFLSRNFVERIA